MAMPDAQDLTIIYIVEPPDYEIMACSLLASIRTHFPPSVKAVGYCPAHRYDELHPAVHIAHEMMNAEIRPFQTEGRFDPAYPHGNKILAAREKREQRLLDVRRQRRAVPAPNLPRGLRGARPGLVFNGGLDGLGRAIDLG